MENREFQARAQQIEQLVQRVSALTDQDARTTALDLLQSVMDLHGAALSRVTELLTSSGESGRKLLVTLGSDPLICGLLVLYGIHPETMQDRVTRAIEKVQRQLRKRGATVELISITDAVVRLKLTAGEHNCGSSPDALKQTVEQAILEAAPEVVEVVAEGTTSASGFVPLNAIQPVTNEEKRYEESPA